MRAINKTALDIKGIEIPISVYSAIESETGFKQFSRCCKSPVRYKKVCEKCFKELQPTDIYKGLDANNEIKTEALKVEAGNLKFLGVVDSDTESEGILRNGKVYFISPTKEKSTTRTQNNLIKFSYLRDTLKGADKTFLCSLSLRGKESLILLKPYKEAFLGLGTYYHEQLRDITELGIAKIQTDAKTIKEMIKKLDEKPRIDIKELANQREELILKLIQQPNNPEVETFRQKQAETLNKEDVKELLNF